MSLNLYLPGLLSYKSKYKYWLCLRYTKDFIPPNYSRNSISPSLLVNCWNITSVFVILRMDGKFSRNRSLNKLINSWNPPTPMDCETIFLHSQMTVTLCDWILLDFDRSVLYHTIKAMIESPLFHPFYLMIFPKCANVIGFWWFTRSVLTTTPNTWVYLK